MNPVYLGCGFFFIIANMLSFVNWYLKFNLMLLCISRSGNREKLSKVTKLSNCVFMVFVDENNTFSNLHIFILTIIIEVTCNVLPINTVNIKQIRTFKKREVLIEQINHQMVLLTKYVSGLRALYAVCIDQYPKLTLKNQPIQN